MITGTTYCVHTISGSCQGDWNTLYHPTEWSSKDISSFETEYFNTGSQYICFEIDDDGLDNLPEDQRESAILEQIESGEGIAFDVYVYGYDDDGIRKEIAEAVGDYTADDVILFKFTGYTRVANWARA
jgi:hypothetical protein